MMIGEHAVVYGHPAIVCAIEQRVTVEVTRRSDDLMRIETTVAPLFEGPTNTLPGDGPLKFVAAALRAMRANAGDGLDISIASEIDPTLGLGSSAAVTIALLGAISAIDRAHLALDDLHERALRIVRDIQGRGSGADLAASLHGGCLSYQISGAASESKAGIKALPLPPTLSLRYCGYKTPTGDVLAKVAEARTGREAHFDEIYEEMGRTAASAISAMQNEHWMDVAQAMTTYQGLMRDLGVSDATIEDIVASATGAMAAKISGSGLGDCILALGTTPEGFTPVEVADRGLVVHENR